MSQSRQSRQNQKMEFVLKFVHIKMKIKFPCTMALQFNKQLITKQVIVNQHHKFIFNEDATFKGEAEGQSFDIFVNLYTEKGTKYTSGVMKLLGGEILRSQGQRLIVPLTKCLDSDAFCEIKVEAINHLTKSLLKLGRSSSKVTPLDNLTSSIQFVKMESQKQLQINETKSEVHFPPKVSSPSDNEKVKESTRSQVYKTFSRSPTNKYSNIKYLTVGQGLFNGKNMPQFPVEEGVSQRYTVAETEVIKQSYQKLKEKYKKESELAKQEAHKRMILEANQNNLKLEIMKYKVKCQGQEKDISDKNEKLKLANNQLTELQKKDIDLAYLREENNALMTKIKLNQDTIHTLGKDNQEIKKLLVDKTKMKDQVISSLKGQLQFSMAKIEEQKNELDLQIRTKDGIIESKMKDLKLRGETIDRQKKMIKELQDLAESKLIDFQKSLSLERNNYENKIEENKLKITTVKTQNSQLHERILFLNDQLEKSKATFSALQFSKKMLFEETVTLNKEIGQFKVIKERYSQLQKEYRLLEGQFGTVRKNLELSLANKDVNIKEFMNKYDEIKEKNQTVKTQNQEKIKGLILRTHQLEIMNQNAKSSLEKNKRINENLSKEVLNVKKKNESLQEYLSQTEKKLLKIQSENHSYQTKYQRQTASLNFLIEKYKSDKAHLEKNEEQLKENIQQLEDFKVLNERKQHEWRIKTRHFQEKIEKDSLKQKQITIKYDNLIKENEQTIRDLDLSIEKMENQSRVIKARLNESQLKEIRHKQSDLRLNKQLVLAKERLNMVQIKLKVKQQDLNVQVEKNKIQENIISEKDDQIAKQKENTIRNENMIEKQRQMVQLLKQQGDKMNKQIVKLQKVIEEHEKMESEIREQLKKCREDLTSEKIRYHKKENQFEKFKESINDIVRLQFAKILKTPPSTQKTERLKESQVSNSIISRSGGQTSRVKVSLDTCVITTALTEKLHETKNNLWKMLQLNKAFKEENNKLMEQFESQNNRHQFTKLQLHRDIQLLEDQMNELVDDKELENENYDHLVIQLNGQLKEKQTIIQELRTQIEEYNGIAEGLKIDFQTNNDLNDKKVSALRANIEELNERIQYLNLNVACLEDKNHELDEKVIEMENQIISHKELLIKNEKNIIDLKENQEDLLKNINRLKKQGKAMGELREELDIKLTTEKEMREKYASMLQEEEKKNSRQNQFIANLIGQKEAAIKNQLEKTEEVNNLQNKVFELNHQNELLKDENQGMKKKNEQLKEEVKRLLLLSKNLEKQLVVEKTKNNRAVEKLKEKQCDINVKKEYIKDLQAQYRQLRDKNYKEIQQLSNELEDKNTSSSAMSKELTDQIIKLQGENKKLWEDCIAIKSEMQNLNTELVNKNEQVEELCLQIKKIEDEKVTLKDQIVSKQFILHERVNQLQKMEEEIDEQKRQINQMTCEIEAYQQNSDLNANQMKIQYDFKIQTLAKEYEQKIELAEKQASFVREIILPLEDNLQKSQKARKQIQLEYEQNKRIYEQKLKKIENERLAIILTKNDQIKKLSEESRSNLNKIHEKESQNRKIGLELEQIKLSTGRTQQYYNYSLEQSKGREKVLGKEIECMKIKEQHNSHLKQLVLNKLYQNEVQIRKAIASTSKKVFQVCNQSDIEKIGAIMKGLESSIVTAMTVTLQNM